MSTKPTAAQEAAAKELYYKLSGFHLQQAIAALLAERDAARAERDTLKVTYDVVARVNNLRKKLKKPKTAPPGPAPEDV